MFKVKIHADESYYQECYSQIVQSKRLKKWEPAFAVLMIVTGLLLRWFDTTRILGLFPFLFSALGVVELIKVFREKRNWMSERLKCRIHGHDLELEFNEEKIKHHGPFAEGELSWHGINRAIQTPKGLLLSPENGISIYIPKASFSSEAQLEFILHKVRSNSLR